MALTLNHYSIRTTDLDASRRFYADGLAAMLAHLQAQGVPFRERTVPSVGLHQLFLDDPCGVMIELNYPAAEKAALGA